MPPRPLEATDTSEVLHSKQPCPCGQSSDAYAVYTDGHGFCFSGNCEKPYHPAPKDHVTDTKSTTTSKPPADLLHGEYQGLTKRRIHSDTCRKFGYHVAQIGEKTVQVANYYTTDGLLIGQKVRPPNKEFFTLGDMKKAGLFGQQLWRDGGKRIVITEGELDCLSVAQVLGLKWPVVSIPSGVPGAKKALVAQLEWLNKFDQIVLAFDADAAGQRAFEECATLFPPGKVASVHWPDPYKDASDMLQAGLVKELAERIWEAKAYRPDGIVTVSDLREELLKDPEEGYPWFLPTLTAYTYGRRLGECAALGAGTGVGKSDFLAQQIAMDVTKLNLAVGAFFLEQSPGETLKRVAGKIGGKTFHIPDGSWEPSELLDAVDKLETGAPLYLYNHFGCTDWGVIKERIRYLAHAEGVKIFYLDHLTALATNAEEDEKTALEHITAEVSSLCQELSIWLLYVSHLTTPEGKSHEEGGRVTIRHFKGSRSIGFWSHFMLGLERNQQAEEEEDRLITIVRILKARLVGTAVGKTVAARYRPNGLLEEFVAEPDETGMTKF